MNDNEQRRAARKACKEKTALRGVYEVRCVETGERSVGAARDLAAMRNRLTFAMEMNDAHLSASLRAAWRQCGEAAFVFEVLEELDPELAAMLIDDELKRLRESWMDKLQAQAI